MRGRHMPLIPHPSYYFRPSSLKGLPALRPYRPRGKEAAAASFPLGGGLVWRSLQTRLSFELGLSQFSIPRLTLHQMSEGGHWDTDMCVDLAWCFYTLEQDLIILLRTTTTYTITHVPIVCYHNHYNTDYAWYSVQIWVIHSAYAHKFTRFYHFTLALTNLLV